MKVNIGPYKDKGKRKVKIHIDNYDTWNMYHTLAMLIVPMLKQLKEEKCGIPADFVNERDKEYATGWHEQLELFNDDLDYYKGESERQWYMTLDHMIWAFEQVLSDENEPYWEPMTPEEIAEQEKHMRANGLDFTFPYKIIRNKMEQYEQQKQEGFDLFAKYFQNLWD